MIRQPSKEFVVKFKMRQPASDSGVLSIIYDSDIRNQNGMLMYLSMKSTADSSETLNFYQKTSDAYSGVLIGQSNWWGHPSFLDGGYVQFEFRFQSDYIYLWVTTADFSGAYGPFPRNPSGGGTPGEYFAISWNSMVMYYCDIEVFPMPLSRRLGDRGKLEVISVGNRHFLCELAGEHKPADYDTEWTGTGVTNATATDDYFDLFDDTNAANQTTGMFLNTAAYQYTRIGERFLILTEMARMPDDSSTDSYACNFKGLYDTSANDNVGLAQNAGTDVWTFATNTMVASKYNERQITFDWPSDGKYYKWAIAINGSEAMTEFAGNYAELEFADAYTRRNNYNDLYFVCRHDAGEISHWRMKTIKEYRILREMRL
jgi:hypothetical protein